MGLEQEQLDLDTSKNQLGQLSRAFDLRVDRHTDFRASANGFVTPLVEREVPALACLRFLSPDTAGKGKARYWCDYFRGFSTEGWCFACGNLKLRRSQWHRASVQFANL